MPFMRVSITGTLDDEKRVKLLEGLQNALWTIPEKKGVPVIIDLEEGKTFYVKGEKMENFVSVDVRYYSHFKYSQKRDLTRLAFDAMHEVLGWSKEHMFLFISERSTWGGHGDYLDEFVTEL